MSNVLSAFLTRRTSCDRLVCGTCGGRLRFLADLQSFARELDDLPSLLAEIREEDVLALSALGRQTPALLAYVSGEDARVQVLAAWAAGPVRAASFAEALLSSLCGNVHRYSAVKAGILAALLPQALESAPDQRTGGRRLRDLLARTLGDELRNNEHFASARERDAQTDLRRAQAAEREPEKRRQAEIRRAEALRARTGVIDEVSALPLHERLRLIIAGETGVTGALPDQWAELTDDEIRKLSATLRVALQRKLSPYRKGPWRHLRRRLHQWTAEVNNGRRSRLIESLEGLPPIEQLRRMAASAFPVQYFPTELAEWGLQHVNEVPADLRSDLAVRLGSQSRGPWRRLRTALA